MDKGGICSNGIPSFCRSIRILSFFIAVGIFIKDNKMLFLHPYKVIFMKKNDWKERLGMVYSTNKDFDFEYEDADDVETLPKTQQRLRVNIEKNGRGGKIVTLVKGFVGRNDDLKDLSKMLKVKCGVGGTAKDGEIVIQGDFKTRVIELLRADGYSDTK